MTESGVAGPQSFAGRVGDRRQFLGLDILRFGAALLVALSHLGVASGFGYFVRGVIGVQMFFILSGFLIAYTGNGLAPAVFLTRRIVRLMPAVWVCASICAALALFAGDGVGDVANRYIRTMVLWPAGRWIDGIYWTLIIECSFYVVVAAGLWAWGPRSMPRIMMVVGGVSAACWAIRLAVMATGIDIQLDQYVGHFLLLVFGCHFATGGMLWVCLRDRATPARLVALAIFAGGVLAQLGYGQRGAAFIVDAIVLFGFIAAMLVSVRLDPVSRYAPVIRMIGLTSYPLYLLHNMLGKALLSALTGVPAPVALAGVLILVTAISAGIAGLVEPLVQRQLRRLLAGVASRGRAGVLSV